MANGNIVEKIDHSILKQRQRSGAFEAFPMLLQSRFGFGALLLEITPKNKQQA